MIYGNGNSLEYWIWGAALIPIIRKLLHQYVTTQIRVSLFEIGNFLKKGE